MARNPTKAKMIARHLLNEVPLTRVFAPRDLVDLSALYADFEHPKLTGLVIRMGANQLASGHAAEEGIH